MKPRPSPIKFTPRNARGKAAPSRIYRTVTAVAQFQGRRCVLEFYDPLDSETANFYGHNVSFAADFTVPLAVMLQETDPGKRELWQVLNPEKYAYTARIERLQPYNPNKTVVLVIHGLKDSQATWTPMINKLRGDPLIRKHYQFWFYSYPSEGRLNCSSEIAKAIPLTCQPSRAFADHMFKSYDGVLKMDGEVENKKVYDLQAYLALAEAAMAERVKQTANNLRASDKTMCAS